MPSKQVNIHFAKTHLSQLLADVERGEEVIIAKAGKPVARMQPVRPSVVVDRSPGQDPSAIVIHDEALAPMSEQELNEWYHGPVFPDDPIKPNPQS